MGFRKDCYATIWGVESISDTYTKCRVSTSHKNKETGEYEQDFSGFVGFVGTNAAKKAANLKEKDRIKIGDIDVTSKYDKEKNITYYNFKVFNFEIASEHNTEVSGSSNEPHPEVDGGDISEDRLPF